MSDRPLSARVAPTHRRGAALARLLATGAALVAGQAVLWQAGGVLPSMPLDRAGAARTFAEAEPLALAAAVMRLGAIGAGAALLAVTALGFAGRCCGAVRLVVHVDRWTPACLRRLLDGALGVGLAASIGLAAGPAGADDRRPAGVTTIHRLPDAPTSTLRRLPDAPPAEGATSPGGLTLRRLPDGPAATSATLPGDPAAAAAAGSPTTPPPGGPAALQTPAPLAEGTAPVTPPAPTVGQAEIVVQPGESFWRLAEQHEAHRLGRQPTEAEIGACWQELIAVNRERLVVADDPDLLFPGQRLTLPCP